MTLTQLILGLFVVLGGGLVLARVAYRMATSVYSNPGYVAVRCFFPAAAAIGFLYYDWCQPGPPAIGSLVANPSPLVAGAPFTLTARDVRYDERPRVYNLGLRFKVDPPRVTFFLTDAAPTEGSQPDDGSHLGDQRLGDDADPGDGYGLRVEPGELGFQGPPRATLKPGRQRIAAEVYQYGQRQRIVTEFEVLAPAPAPVP